MTVTRAPRKQGKVRAARLTDLAALGELSRLCQSDDAVDPLARTAGQRPADRGVQPVPAAARRLSPERPDVRLRGGWPDRRTHPRGAGVDPRRVDDRRARCGRHGRRRRHPLPAGQPAPARGRQARCRAIPRRVCRRRRERGTDDAGGLHPLRRGADHVPPGRRATRSRGPTRPRATLASGPPNRSTRWRSTGCTRPRRPAPWSGSRRSACPTGSARGTTGGCPAPALRRSCASPTSRRSCSDAPGGGKDGTELDAFIQVGVAKEDQPHYLKVVVRPEADPTAIIALRTRHHRGPHDPGQRAPSRPRRHLTRANL